MKQYIITVTEISNEYDFCIALSLMSGASFKDVNDVVKNTNFPIDLNDLFKKYSGAIFAPNFTETQAKIVKEKINNSAELKIEEYIQYPGPYTQIEEKDDHCYQITITKFLNKSKFIFALHKLFDLPVLEFAKAVNNLSLPFTFADLKKNLSKWKLETYYIEGDDAETNGEVDEKTLEEFKSLVLNSASFEVKQNFGYDSKVRMQTARYWERYYGCSLERMEEARTWAQNLTGKDLENYNLLASIRGPTAIG